jgi:hypothetical protein
MAPTGDVLYRLFPLFFVSWLGPEKQGHWESVFFFFGREFDTPLTTILVDCTLFVS